MPQLPQELIDHIIDCLAANSKSHGLWLGADLLQCSCASRSFRPRCLIYIFSSIYIHGKDLEGKRLKMKALLEIIEGQPTIASYIEELVLTNEDMQGPTAGYGPRYYSTLLREPTFSIMMEKISPIHKLTITKNSGKVHTSSKAEADSVSLMNHLLLPIALNVSSLSLHALDNMPLEVFTSFINLTSLELLYVGLTREHEPIPQESLQSPPTLRHFGYQKDRFAQINIREFFELSRINISQLKSLTVYTVDNVSQGENVVDPLFTSV